jgi:hypothetical protein
MIKESLRASQNPVTADHSVDCALHPKKRAGHRRMHRPMTGPFSQQALSPRTAGVRVYRCWRPAPGRTQNKNLWPPLVAEKLSASHRSLRQICWYSLSQPATARMATRPSSYWFDGARSYSSRCPPPEFQRANQLPGIRWKRIRRTKP